jgi:D-alanine transfer protein
MTKIKAFFTALALFIVFVTCLHLICLNISLKDRAGSVGTWSNPYKDMSYSWTSENMGSDVMPVLGSSEFNHGRTRPYHPFNVFRGTDVKIMNIGGPFNQTLFHTVFIGSAAENVRYKKVVLLLSPTWFKKDGVSPQSYSLRFSMGEYIHFMQNKKISAETKKYVMDRSESLLKKSNEKMYSKVRLVDDYLVRGKDGIVNAALFRLLSMYTHDTDVVTTRAAMTARDLKNKKVHAGFDAKCKKWEKKYSPGGHVSWGLLYRTASKESAKHSKDNSFYMYDKTWNKSLKSKYNGLKNYHSRSSWAESPEYSDLEAFLMVCRDNGIKVKLIVQPVNGYWYDYTGFPASRRRVMSDKAEKIARKYGAGFASLQKYEYNRYITMDAVHPWGKGWLRIDEQIDSFYNE